MLMAAADKEAPLEMDRVWLPADMEPEWRGGDMMLSLAID